MEFYILVWYAVAIASEKPHKVVDGSRKWILSGSELIECWQIQDLDRMEVKRLRSIAMVVLLTARCQTFLYQVKIAVGLTCD